MSLKRKHIFYRGGALDHELRALYEERGKLPDMTRLEHEYHRRTTRILIGFVMFFAVLTTASWAGFFLFGQQSRSEIRVSLAFDAPIASVSGVPQTIRLHYKNRDRDPLGSATITLRPPKGLTITATEPPSAEVTPLRWNLGTLPAGTDGTITITAIPYGLIENKIPLAAVLTYKPSNFNAEFQTVAEDSLEIRAAGIDATISGLPETITPGQETTLILAYENKTDETFTDLVVIPDFPPSFTVVSKLMPPNPATTSSPRQSTNTTLPISSLAPGARGVIEIKGAFSSGTTGPQALNFRIAKNGTDFALILAQASAQTELQGGTIAAGLAYTINNNQELRAVRFGDQISLQLTITNNSPETITDVSADITIASPLVNTDMAGADKNGLIHFPKEGVISIAPKERVQKTVVLPIVSTASTATPALIEIEAIVHAGDLQIKTNKLIISAVSNLKVTASARYFGADQKPIGSGPLPPRVGEQTTFELRWHLTNSFHDLSSIGVIGILPPGVSWTNKKQVGSGTISFNPTTREVRWEIPRMPISIPELNASFEVAVTPTEDQRGSLLLLLGVTRVEVQDTIVQAPFSTDAPSISSSLDSDPFARGKGVVGQ